MSKQCMQTVTVDLKQGAEGGGGGGAFAAVMNFTDYADELLDDHGVVLAALRAADVIRIDQALGAGALQDVFRAAISQSLPGVVPWPNTWWQCEARFIDRTDSVVCDRNRGHMSLHATRGPQTLDGSSLGSRPIIAVWSDAQCARRTTPIADWSALVAYAQDVGYRGSLAADARSNGDGADLPVIAGWRLDRLADGVDEWRRNSGWEVDAAAYGGSPDHPKAAFQVSEASAGHEIRVQVSVEQVPHSAGWPR